MGLTRNQKIMVAVLLSGAILVILNATLLSPALPHIMRDTGVDATTVQWLTSAYSLVEAVVIPLNAFIVGKFPTRKLFIGGIAWFGVSCIIAACAPNFWVILLGRIMMACATGIIMPMVFTLILLIFPREQRGSAMGMVGLMIAFAPAIGPTLSGVLVDSVGWRMLFVVIAVICVIVDLFAFKFLTNFDNFEEVPFDAPSVAMLLVGMLSLLYGISSSTTAENIAVPIVLIVAGLIILGVFCKRQLKLETPVLRIQVLSSRKFRTVVIIIALLQASMIGSEVVLPIYVQQVMGQTATVSGLLMLPGAVIGAICGLVAGRLFDNYGVRGLAIFGACVLGIGAFGVTTFSMDMSIIMVTVVYSTMSIGIQFLSTPLNTWGVNSLDNKVVQHANALSSTMNQVGVSVGTAFIVSLTALGHLFAPEGASAVEVTYAGVHVSFCGMAIMLACVVLGILFFVRDTKADAAVEAQRKAELAELAEKAERENGVPGVDRPFLVADVMNPNPNTVRDTATIREAIDAMRATETSGLPVVDAENNLVAFISDGDVMKYLSNESGNYNDGSNYYRIVENEDFWTRLSTLLDLNVMRIATKKVIAMGVGEDAEDAFNTLAERRIKKVPVIKNGKVVGTLSRRNIINTLATAEQMLTEMQR